MHPPLPDTRGLSASTLSSSLSSSRDATGGLVDYTTPAGATFRYTGDYGFPDPGVERARGRSGEVERGLHGVGQTPRMGEQRVPTQMDTLKDLGRRVYNLGDPRRWDWRGGLREKKRIWGMVEPGDNEYD